MTTQVCEACREQIGENDPEVIEAVEIVPVPGFGAPNDTAEGLRVVFHRDCFPAGSPRYRRIS